MPYQIIYISESSTPMQLDDLEDMLESARLSNAQDGISGALVYFDRVFLQILEGSKEAVAALMARIARDLRHEQVTVLQEGEIPLARFSNWSMAYVSATNEQVAAWAGLGALTKASEMPKDLSHDSQRTAQLAQGILSFLTVDKVTAPSVD